jgi:hypothetical protein
LWAPYVDSCSSYYTAKEGSRPPYIAPMIDSPGTFDHFSGKKGESPLRFRNIFLPAVMLFWFISASLFSGEALEARLVIVGPGDPLYTYWGHIGIALENRETGEDLFYDFGNFSFYSENFYQDFAMGRMMYLGFVTPTDYFISYSLKEDRDLRIYPLNLGDEELRKLDEILRWWVLPENSEYLYDYFLNNCSTIIRDILDDVTGGELKRETATEPDLNYRHYARTGAHESTLSELLLHYLLGSNIDKPISEWDKMFIPQTVADIALRTVYTGRDGERRRLVEEEIVLKESDRLQVPVDPKALWPWMLVAGIAAGIIWRLSGTVKRKSLRITGTILRVLIVLSVGIPGLLLGFMMTFTDHASTYRNINLWPTFPTILLALIPIFAALGKDKIVRRKKEIQLSWIWTVNLAGLLLAVILRLSGQYAQNAGAFWALSGPLSLAGSLYGLRIQDRLVRIRKAE